MPFRKHVKTGGQRVNEEPLHSDTQSETVMTPSTNGSENGESQAPTAHLAGGHDGSAFRHEPQPPLSTLMESYEGDPFRDSIPPAWVATATNVSNNSFSCGLLPSCFKVPGEEETPTKIRVRDGVAVDQSVPTSRAPSDETPTAVTAPAPDAAYVSDEAFNAAAQALHGLTPPTTLEQRAYTIQADRSPDEITLPAPVIPIRRSNSLNQTEVYQHLFLSKRIAEQRLLRQHPALRNMYPAESQPVTQAAVHQINQHSVNAPAAMPVKVTSDGDTSSNYLPSIAPPISQRRARQMNEADKTAFLTQFLRTATAATATAANHISLIKFARVNVNSKITASLRHIGARAIDPTQVHHMRLAAEDLNDPHNMKNTELLGARLDSLIKLRDEIDTETLSLEQVKQRCTTVEDRIKALQEMFSFRVPGEESDAEGESLTLGWYEGRYADMLEMFKAITEELTDIAKEQVKKKDVVTAFALQMGLAK